MRHSILVVGVLLLSSWAAVGSAQSFAWSRAYGSSGFDQAIDVATDADDNVLVVGFFSSSVDFDPGVGEVSRTSNGATDMFVQKLDSAGNLVWVETFGGTGGDQAVCVDVDPAGNVYVGGAIRDTVGFGSGLGASLVTSEGSEDAFLLKLDADGNFEWVRSWGSANGDIVNGVAVNSAGNVVVGGWFSETMDLNPGVSVDAQTSAGETDIWVAQLDANGDFAWGQVFGDTATDVARDVAIDESGNVLVVGDFRGAIDFDPGVVEVARTSAGNSDLFIQKLTTAGALDWVVTLGSTSNEVAYGVTVDSSGSIYSTGRFSSTVDFDPSGVESNLTASGSDAFVLKLASDSAFGWARRVGSNANEQGQSIAVDSLGNVYSGGIFRSTTNFDVGVSNFSLASAGNEDAYQLALDNAGNFLWATRVGGTLADYGYGIAVDTQSSVVAVGYFQGTADLDPTDNISNVATIGSLDGFAVKITQDIVVVEGEGVVDGEGLLEGEGLADGEGLVEGEGGLEGEGNVEGEGALDGEGVVDGEGALEGEGSVDGEGSMDGEGEPDTYATDIDGNFVISLAELLRVVQFYNALGIHCADVPSETEDGFVPGSGANQTCTPYDADYSPQDWVVSLTELLRVIQFYNTLGYSYCPSLSTEDDFCPGLL